MDSIWSCRSLALAFLISPVGFYWIEIAYVARNNFHCKTLYEQIRLFCPCGPITWVSEKNKNGGSCYITTSRQCWRGTNIEKTHQQPLHSYVVKIELSMMWGDQSQTFCLSRNSGSNQINKFLCSLTLCAFGALLFAAESLRKNFGSHEVQTKKSGLTTFI